MEFVFPNFGTARKERADWGKVRRKRGCGDAKPLFPRPRLWPGAEVRGCTRQGSFPPHGPPGATNNPGRAPERAARRLSEVPGPGFRAPFPPSLSAPESGARPRGSPRAKQGLRPGRGDAESRGHGRRAHPPAAPGSPGDPPDRAARAPPRTLGNPRPSPPGAGWRAAATLSAQRPFSAALTHSAGQARGAQQEDPQQCDRDPAAEAGHGSGAPGPRRGKRLWPVVQSGGRGPPSLAAEALRSTPARSPARGADSPWLRPAPREHELAGSVPSSLSASPSCLHSRLSPGALRPVATFLGSRRRPSHDFLYRGQSRAWGRHLPSFHCLGDTERRPLCSPFSWEIKSVEHPSHGSASASRFGLQALDFYRRCYWYSFQNDEPAANSRHFTDSVSNAHSNPSQNR